MSVCHRPAVVAPGTVEAVCQVAVVVEAAGRAHRFTNANATRVIEPTCLPQSPQEAADSATLEWRETWQVCNQDLVHESLLATRKLREDVLPEVAASNSDILADGGLHVADAADGKLSHVQTHAGGAFPLEGSLG